MYVGMYVYMWGCMYVCGGVGVYVCVWAVCICVWGCMYMCLGCTVCVWGCMHVCVSVYTYIGTRGRKETGSAKGNQLHARKLKARKYERENLGARKYERKKLGARTQKREI
jgi:hypothetical protein